MKTGLLETLLLNLLLKRTFNVRFNLDYRMYLDNKLTLNFPIYSFGPLCSYFTVIITPFQNLLAVISRGKRLISFGGLNFTILESMSLTCLTAYLRDGTGRVSKDVTILYLRGNELFIFILQ